MKKLIVCLTFAAFATLSLRAGENCSEKTAACAEKAQASCCAATAKTACASKATTAKKAAKLKGAQLLARR